MSLCISYFLQSVFEDTNLNRSSFGSGYDRSRTGAGRERSRIRAEQSHNGSGAGAEQVRTMDTGTQG
jgi:hypothetical protein